MISLRSNYGWYCNFDFPRAPNRTMSHFFPPFGDWPKSLLEPNYQHQNQSTIVKLQARFGSNNPQIAKQKIEPLGLVNLIDPLLITFTRWELFSKRLCYIERWYYCTFSPWVIAHDDAPRVHVYLGTISGDGTETFYFYLSPNVLDWLLIWFFSRQFFHFFQNWRSFKKDWKRLIDATFLSTVDIWMVRLTQMH